MLHVNWSTFTATASMFRNCMKTRFYNGLLMKDMHVLCDVNSSISETCASLVHLERGLVLQQELAKLKPLLTKLKADLVEKWCITLFNRISLSFNKR